MNKLTKAIFPNLKYSKDDILNKYKRRDENTVVTRLAPSPTGFLHIGGVYTAMINEHIAHQNGGVFMLRIEDTDKKREQDGAVDIICEVFKRLGLNPDEGVITPGQEKGEYGPYVQSMRVDIYHAFAADLLERGLAYPCFATEEELNDIREKQAENKETPGYYGKYAIYRDYPVDEAIKRIEAGEEFVLRFRVPEDEPKRVSINDLIKGEIEMDNNFNDFVLLKNDMVPTYHFAHAVDDYLMGTTVVIRGDEWVSSLPIHIELFKYLGFKRPDYAHVAPVMKMDGESRRKLSKRKDPEANAMYYIEKGYPVKAIYAYLYTLINSNFEEWYLNNPNTGLENFKFTYENMGIDGPLFDLSKLDNISREIIYNTDCDTNVKNMLDWAYEFDKDLYNRLTGNLELLTNIFKTQGPESNEKRKDLANYSSFINEFGFLYNDIFEQNPPSKDLLLENVAEANINYLRDGYLAYFSQRKNGSEKTMKELAKEMGYTDKKKYMKNPEAYKGMLPEFYHFLRILVTGKTQGISMDDVIDVIGLDEVIRRVKEF